MKIVRQYDLAGKSAGLGRASAKLQQTALCVCCMLLLGALNWSVEWYQPGKKSIEAMAAHMCFGARWDEVAPFWRVVDPASPLARKLSCGPDFIRKRREAEGIGPSKPMNTKRGRSPKATKGRGRADRR